ncbi:MAG: GNAT family N-acetyltransferase [[Clostridium] fimetarium]|nr:GNAT family N-acetyltransferase [Alistipes timonensis]MCM1405671.1 GNAT family N-acetyltransferase [[Clostridium] fimetarium]
MNRTLKNGAILRLRAPEPSDVDTLYIWENSPEMWDYGFFQAPYSRQQIWEYIRDYDSNPLRSGQLRLIIEVGGEPAGSVDLYDIDTANRRAMVGVMVSARFRGMGCAAAALDLMAEYAAGPLALSQLAATVAEDNEASAALFAKAGYELTATLPRWVRRGSVFVSALIFQKQLPGS